MHTVVFTGAIVAQVPKTTYQAFTRSCARAALRYRAALNNKVGSNGQLVVAKATFPAAPTASEALLSRSYGPRSRSPSIGNQAHK